MTLAEMKILHAYNSWADNRIFDALTALSPEQYVSDMKSSHGGIHGTLVHLVGAEKIWLERWLGTPRAFLTTEQVQTLAEVKKAWESVGLETARWLGTLTDKKIQETFTMKTAKGDTFTHVYWQAFQHLVNHSSYHRGQIITMIRQIGGKPVSTDLIQFYRETAPR